MTQHLKFMISNVEQIFFYKLFLLLLISYLTATIVQITRSERVSHPVESLCDSKDCSPSGSSVHGIFQARVLEWDAIAFSKLED